MSIIQIDSYDVAPGEAVLVTDQYAMPLSIRACLTGHTINAAAMMLQLIVGDNVYPLAACTRINFLRCYQGVATNCWQHASDLRKFGGGRGIGIGVIAGSISHSEDTKLAIEVAYALPAHM